MRYQEFENCAVRVSVQMIAGKWKCLIIYVLKDDSIRFNDLWRAMPKISKKVLSEQLTEMYEDGLVNRLSDPSVPGEIHYSLTHAGRDLIPLLCTIEKWGLANVKGALSVERKVSFTV